METALEMKKSLVDRFWDKVDRPEEGCWPWVASTDEKGYGFIKRGGYGRKGSSNIRAHRVSWMLFNGPIPEGMCICHKCDNPNCVNPEHLFLGTMKDNCHDRDRKGRQRSRKGEEHNLAKLNWRQVEELRDLVLAHGMSQGGVAQIFSISQTVVSKIVLGQLWKNQS